MINENLSNLDFKNIGAKIRLERENLNLTREKLAELLDLSPYYIGQIERGERKMSVETLVNISKILHVSIDYLLDNSCEIDNKYVVSESFDQYKLNENDDELKELFSILKRCSKEEISLITDLVKLILPYIK
ncbi:DNA-binding XRE family transcriptional regulator [Keratinibaculum paraultunense]|uniref:DNA-binding XRE family transcriptional regulator n=1 Tax=Keratinibaculum paraultunense TaxID=1278232 RepID=A0A4V2UU16_9FIRM|nr:helix-turn-helix domain-containing protein [Keratinibaculum paraultunense]QQY79832.1 helix-turn-helix domain-containing protein [Keratinibaculum paraultunense]TCS88713.1 DNA-binding XRE family transcriptional regulator [Keratinibaculum paraultunense]